MSVAVVALLLSSVFLSCRGATPRRLVAGVQPGDSGTCPTSTSARERWENITSRVRSILENDVLPELSCDLGSCRENPAGSCSHVYAINASAATPGYYWLTRCDGSTYQAYCVRNSPCGCSGSTAGWKRIAFLNTTDTSQACPGGTRLFPNQPIRTCARLTHGCVSLVYSTDYMPYQHVCGRVIGFQYRSPDAFSPYYEDRSKTIDDNYMDGVSITYGYSPRKHIWTMTAGLDETRTDFRRCPCANRLQAYTGVVPSFVGNDYFCETGSRSAVGTDFYTADPLWDGKGCGSVSTCCTSTTAPWFCKALSNVSRENVEVRLCGDESNENENIPIQLIELYVQ